MPFGLVSRAGKDCVGVAVVDAGHVEDWLAEIPPAVRDWLRRTGFSGEAGRGVLLPFSPRAAGKTPGGTGQSALFVAPAEPGPWGWAGLAEIVSEGCLRLIAAGGAPALAKTRAEDAALGWALASYRFARYRAGSVAKASLVWPRNADRSAVERAARATYLVRDLVTTPANDMGPAELAASARSLGNKHGAKLRVIKGDALLRAGYPAIHAVGRASARAPRLVDLRWGGGGPKVTIVGKGVCFDSGGLDLKTATGMQLMKKDMGGAAHALALAGMIMEAGLPVRLRLLVAAVENAVGGNAYRPGDVIETRKGLTVEVGNTDAEGRLVLADCLAEAAREAPEIIIDFATLTGAARVALGTELPALFCTDDALAGALEAAGRAVGDPLWRMPLHAPYRRLLESAIADISSTGKSSYAGAVTAALFLREFVPKPARWAHFDIMAWNLSTRPGRPEGGEAMGLRAAFAVLKDRYANPADGNPAQ